MRNSFELVTLIFTTEEKKSEKLDKEFVVKINDRGFYLDELIKLVKKHTSVNSVINKLQYGDYLVFTKNDVYRDTNDDRVADLDLNQYKLTHNWNKIEKLINNFFNNVYTSKQTYKCPFEETDCDDCLFNINRRNNQKKDIIYRDGQYIDMKERINICYNHVKVGYDNYDIYTRNFGYKEYVDIEGETFEIKSDYKGKYLKLIK